MLRPTLVLCALSMACAAGQESVTEAGTTDLVEASTETSGDVPDDTSPEALSPSDTAPIPDTVTALDRLDTTIDASIDASTDVSSDVSTDSMDAGPPPDAGPMADGLPTDAVMYFTGTTCPHGWEVYPEAVGRVAMPTVSVALLGVQRGAPLADGEDRVHTHTLSGSLTVPAVSYAGVAGCCNDGVGRAATLPFMASVREASSGLPYLQLLVCRKTGPARTAPLPPGMMVFFASARCPAGFTRAEEPQGHLPVATPIGGLHGARFGATPPGTSEPRPHRHEASPTLTTTPQGIALAGGCCAGDYAAHGTYRPLWSTREAEAGPPTVQLLLCQKD